MKLPKLATNHSVMIIFILLFSLIASILLAATHAASPVVEIQPESTSVNSPALVQSDSSASGGKYIQFNKSGLTKTVPSTIDSTGAQDVTTSLNSFLSGLANNTTVNFAVNGRYRIEGTLLLSQKSGITINGNGSTFFATTNGSAVEPSPCDPKTQGYTFCYPNRARMQWDFESDVNLLVENTNVVGASTNPGTNGTYLVQYEGQAGYEIGSGDGITLNNVTAKNTWGDLVYVGGGNSHIAATNVLVQNSTLDGSSRQCMSVVDGDHVSVLNNHIAMTTGCRMALFDLEDNTSSDQITFINIHDNDLGVSRFATLDNAGSQPGTQHDITFDGNRMHNQRIYVDVYGLPNGHRQNYHITNNVGSTVANSGIIFLRYVDGAVVTGNTQSFNTSWPVRTYLVSQAPIWTNCSTNVSVANNIFNPLPTGMPVIFNHCV